MKKHGGHIVGFFVLLFMLFLFVFFLLFLGDKRPPVYGVTFSALYADQLGLDWREVYTATVNELAIQKIRIPVYWSEIEQEQGVFEYTSIDWMLDQIHGKGIDVTLVVGQKQPRWPECFIPDWAEVLSIEQRHLALDTFITETVERYHDRDEVERWQVENEPFFPFGECPRIDTSYLEAEVALVQSLDTRPIVQTMSGEQSFWFSKAFSADVIGVSLYRIVRNDQLGFFTYPHTPLYYRWQGRFVNLFSHVIISELQAEPWGANEARIGEHEGLQEAYALFTTEDLQEHIDFARRTGIEEQFFWGVEWWYYMKEHGDNRLWDFAQNMIADAL